MRVALSSLRLSTVSRLTDADGFFAIIRANTAHSSANAAKRSGDVVSSAASRLAVGPSDFALVANVPSPFLGA